MARLTGSSPVDLVRASAGVAPGLTASLGALCELMVARGRYAELYSLRANSHQ